MDVGLVARPGVGTLDVGRELMAQLFRGVQRSWGQVCEP
jgi:hypothetical protein